ncbi:uncharacterized protein METZ01_LOCUS294901, partial [marine metagenome]
HPNPPFPNQSFPKNRRISGCFKPKFVNVES